MTSVQKLDCKGCNQSKTMEPKKISKMSTVVVVIGWIIAFPSIIGVIASLVMFISSVGAGAEVTANAQSEAEEMGAAIGAGLGMGFSIIMGIFSLLGGLIGYILIMKKKVWKCIQCGFIIDRA